MTAQRHNRIISLENLNTYPGSDCIDCTFFLPDTKDDEAIYRIWLSSSSGKPKICVDQTELPPKEVFAGPPRWVDYGVSQLPRYFTQLRIYGMDAADCAGSFLVVTKRLDESFVGCSGDQAQRKLWGLARCDAGTTTIGPSRASVGYVGEFVVRYAAGPGGLPGGALIRFAVAAAFDRPQTHDAGAAGFVSIERADSPVTVERIEDSAEGHQTIDVVCRLDSSLEAFAGFELRYRTGKTYIFPNLFHEVDRQYWYSKLPPLSAAVAIDGESDFVSLDVRNGHSVEFVPGPAERLHLFLPGRRFASDELTLGGVFTDHFRNVPPAGPIPANVEIHLVGDDGRVPLGSPAGRFVARHRFVIPLSKLSPGVYRAVAVRSDSGEQVASSNPMMIMDDANGHADRLYWGEIHGHTEMSDGCGDYGQLYRHARDEGRLDFAAAADHACYFSDNQWLWMQDVTNYWNEPGRFVTLVGYEWAGKQSHRNIYTSRDSLKLFRGMYPPTSSIGEVWRHFHDDRQIVGGPHAYLAHGIIWQHYDPSVERFAEIYSVWGAGDFRDSPLAPPHVGQHKRKGLFALLDEGAKLGFTGGGDCHEGHVGFTSEDPTGQGKTCHTFASEILYHCGMTAAAMPALDRESLVEAIRNRRTYATTGPRILLEFSAGGLPMGAVGHAEHAQCNVEVHGTNPIDRIEFISNGEIVHSQEGDGLDVLAEWQDPRPLPDRQSYYCVRVIQADGETAWSSPVWLRPCRQ